MNTFNTCFAFISISNVKVELNAAWKAKVRKRWKKKEKRGKKSEFRCGACYLCPVYFIFEP